MCIREINLSNRTFDVFFCLFCVGKHLVYTLVGILIRFMYFPRFQFLPFLLENRLPFLFRAAKRYWWQRIQIFVIFVPLVHKVHAQVAFGPGFHFTQRTCCKINRVEMSRTNWLNIYIYIISIAKSTGFIFINHPTHRCKKFVDNRAVAHSDDNNRNLCKPLLRAIPEISVFSYSLFVF